MENRRVAFGKDALRATAEAPLVSPTSDASPTSPRALKILSRKKTPFTEDLQHSLAEFQAEAEMLRRAQQDVRAEERRRLKDSRMRRYAAASAEKKNTASSSGGAAVATRKSTDTASDTVAADSVKHNLNVPAPGPQVAKPDPPNPPTNAAT